MDNKQTITKTRCLRVISSSQKWMHSQAGFQLPAAVRAAEVPPLHCSYFSRKGNLGSQVRWELQPALSWAVGDKDWTKSPRCLYSALQMQSCQTWVVHSLEYQRRRQFCVLWLCHSVQAPATLFSLCLSLLNQDNDDFLAVWKINYHLLSCRAWVPIVQIHVCIFQWILHLLQPPGLGYSGTTTTATTKSSIVLLASRGNNPETQSSPIIGTRHLSMKWHEDDVGS